MPKKNNAMTSPRRAVPVPANEEGIETTISQIRSLYSKLQQRETEHNQEVADAIARAIADLEPVEQELRALAEGLFIFCKEHRRELLPEGAKSRDFMSGRIGWRDCPDSLAITNENAVIALLEKKGLQRFIRTKREVDRESLKSALLDPKRSPGEIKGVKISKNEQFYLWLAQVEKELTATKTGKFSRVSKVKPIKAEDAAVESPESAD